MERTERSKSTTRGLHVTREGETIRNHGERTSCHPEVGPATGQGVRGEGWTRLGEVRTSVPKSKRPQEAEAGGIGIREDIMEGQ